jgi:DNA-binding transcriptional ArsR family regulator
MATFSERLQGHALDLAWSLWAELGVSGWQRRHTSHAIDPELLILLTAFLGDADPRLRDEATDWCITYGRYVSAARLKNLVTRESEETKKAFGEFTATVNAHSGLRWPGATEPRRFMRTDRSELLDFRRPSLVVLRVRALFGVGARAEIVRAFLADPSVVLSAADLAAEAEYTKRNVAEGLDALRMAGLLEVAPVRNQLRYRLARPDELTALVGELPSVFPSWRPVFRILEHLLETARTDERLETRVRAVEAAKVLHELERDLRVAGVRAPPLDTADHDLWRAFERWSSELAKDWALGLMKRETNGSVALRRGRHPVQ